MKGRDGMVRIGLVGCGVIGRAHLQVLKSIPGCEVSGVVDRQAAAAERASEEFGVPAFGTADALIDSGVDGVVVAVPETEHLSVASFFLERGIPVLLEKPLADSVPHGEALVAVAERTGTPLQVGYVLRYEPTYVKIKEAVQAGMVGRLHSIYARRIAPWSEALRYNGRVSVVNYLSVHDIDQVLWYYPDERVVEVTAVGVCQDVWDEVGTWDQIWATLRLGGGAIVVLQTGWDLPGSWDAWSRLGPWQAGGQTAMVVQGSKGVVCLESPGFNVWGVGDTGWSHPDLRRWTSPDGRVYGGLRAQDEAFVWACVAEGRSPCPGGREALRSLRVAEAIERSIAARAPVACWI